MAGLQSKMVQIAVAVLLAGLAIDRPQAATLSVNHPADTHDALPGDGICADNDGHCTLRAAIDEANLSPTDTIAIGSGIGPIYLHLGSLKVTQTRLSIMGADSTAIVDGRLNPEGTDIFDIHGPDCAIWGVTIAHSRRHGIRLRSSGCVIGDSTTRTMLFGNGLADSTAAAIAIESVADANIRVESVLIGVKGNGTVVAPNFTGIRITKSSGVTIGGPTPGQQNVISGNSADGILIDSNSSGVWVLGNYIGLDVTGRTEAANGRDGISIRGGASFNRIGGTSMAERNLISGNLGRGISISGRGTNYNLIAGNFIGLDSSGYFSVGNHFAGICIAEGASRNKVGYDSAGVSRRLIVAGNFGNGIEIVGTGTDSNVVDWAYVGLDGRGDAERPNGLATGQGILIASGASHNVIGSDGAKPRNVISGNYGPGISIAGNGTDRNVVVGNYIGVYRLGNSPQGNSAGVVIRDSAQYNEIGTSSFGNLISGNRGDLFPLGAGVVIFGDLTNFNTVRSNLIGTDYTGTRTIRNGSAGVVIGGGACSNMIGGDSTLGNQISGNGTAPFSSGLGAGIHIFGPGTDSNVISGNTIGVAADKVSPLRNNGHGIGIFAGATNTIIGGDTPGMRNIIATNRHTGVWIDGPQTTGHVVRFNAMFDNDSGAITLHAGANMSIVPPTILGVSADSIWGISPNAGALVDIYRASSNQAGKVHGAVHLAQTVARADASFACQIAGLVSGDSVTAIETVDESGSSAFSAPLPMPVPTDVKTDSIDASYNLTLHQNHPNPFNNNTIVSYATTIPGLVSLEIFNMAGQRVRLLRRQLQPAGAYSIDWDGTNDDGRSVASGTYFYRLTTEEGSITRKMVLLK